MSSVPSIHTRCTKLHWSRTAVSSSTAENRKPPSPDTEMTLRAGSARQAAIAQGSATPSVCWPLLIRICRGRCAIRWRAIQMWKAPVLLVPADHGLAQAARGA